MVTATAEIKLKYINDWKTQRISLTYTLTRITDRHGSGRPPLVWTAGWSAWNAGGSICWTPTRVDGAWGKTVQLGRADNMWKTWQNCERHPMTYHHYPPFIYIYIYVLYIYNIYNIYILYYVIIIYSNMFPLFSQENHRFLMWSSQLAMFGQSPIWTVRSSREVSGTTFYLPQRFHPLRALGKGGVPIDSSTKDAVANRGVQHSYGKWSKMSLYILLYICIYIYIFE